MLIYVRDGLIMRTLSANDAATVFAAVDSNRQYLRTWLPWVDATHSPDDTAGVIATWAKALKTKADAVFGMFEHGEYVGNIGLHDANNYITPPTNPCATP